MIIEKNQIAGIIFDFDGTLIDSEHANIEAAVKTFFDLNSPLSDEEIGDVHGKSSLDLVPVLLKRRNISQENIGQIVALYRKNYDALWDSEVRLMPHAKEVLALLKSRGKRLAIATTNRKSTVEKFIAKFNLQTYFYCYATVEDVERRKPDPQTYNVAKLRMGLPSPSLIAVEDTKIGVTAAKSAGLRCVAIPSEYSATDDFSAADFVLASLGELPDLLGI